MERLRQHSNGAEFDFIDQIFGDMMDMMDIDKRLFSNRNDVLIWDKPKSQKIPVVNVYKHKKEDSYVVDIATGLFRKRDFSIEIVEKDNRNILVITAKTNEDKDLKDYSAVIRQIPNHDCVRKVEFLKKIKDVKVMENAPEGIIRLKVILEDNKLIRRISL